MVQNYYDRGVRHVFLIHFYDNEFGGATLSNLLNSPRNSCRPQNPKGDKSNEGNRTLTQISRILAVGDMFAVIPHQGARDQIL
jgi:microsomal dipeptidase-like Zn-dependent dipeptidase